MLGFGPFATDLEDVLQYELTHYDTVKPGQPVVVELLECETNDISRDLAEALGGDLWDFATHHIEFDKVDWDMLGEMNKPHAEWLAELLTRGFTLLICPNG